MLTATLQLAPNRTRRTNPNTYTPNQDHADRSGNRTRGHAFVVMLVYALIKELATRWQPLDLTVKEGIDQLATLCLTEVRINDQAPYHQVPTPRDTLQRLLDAAQVSPAEELTYCNH